MFLSDYADHQENQMIYMPGTGDFGDAGSFYFAPAKDYWMEGDLIGVSGAVMSWNSNMNCYIHKDMFTGYFSANASALGRKTTYCLDHVTIGY